MKFNVVKKKTDENLNKENWKEFKKIQSCLKIVKIKEENKIVICKNKSNQNVIKMYGNKENCVHYNIYLFYWDVEGSFQHNQNTE